jgi:putative membrane protein
LSIHDLPALNATLNAISAVLLLVAYRFIRRGQWIAHKRTMLAAFSVSVVFLISYIVYHAHVGSVRYPGSGAMRVVYLTILATHTVLAATVPVLAIITLRRGLKGRFDKHRRIAKWTFPVWLYVNVTGVVVYMMLYRF